MSDLTDLIRNLRNEFTAFDLDEAHMEKHPFKQFDRWMRHAIESNVNEPNAMTLATHGRSSGPSARIVLLRELDKKGFVFFTNYKSRKGREMASNKKVCLNFFWPELQRQIRIQGRVEKLSSKASEDYFKSRPRESQIGAWASFQSEKLKSRAELEERFVALELKYADKPVPRPPHWGGYRVIPDHIEFWQGRMSRLHDRIAYQKSRTGKWSVYRLNP